MTPKEKAIELYLNYYHNMYAHWDTLECELVAKGCALIAVDEIISITNLANEGLNYKDYSNDNTGFKSYWQEVKKEIELL